MKLKILGIDIYVSVAFCSIITLMLVIDRTGSIIPLLAGTAVHELGHLIAMRNQKNPVQKIMLVPAALLIVGGVTSSDKEEIKTVFAGPVANIAVGGFFLLLFLAIEKETLLLYAVVQLALAIFNLLPVKGLDGGTLLFIALRRKMELSTAELLVNIISFIFSTGLAILGTLLFVAGPQNPSLLICGIYLVILTLIN